MSDAPSIYDALNGLVSAQRDLIAMLRGTIDDWERREEELRDAHLDLANALNRRMDELHTRIDDSYGELMRKYAVMTTSRAGDLKMLADGSLVRYQENDNQWHPVEIAS